MHLSVLTPDVEYFSGQITSIKVPGAAGQFQVLKNHAPIVSALVDGAVEVKTSEGKLMKFVITGGFIEVLNNKVALLVQSITE